MPVDWWIGELLAAERVMWVIAGRYKIEQIGELNFEDLEGGIIENYTVDVFDKVWSDKYLKENGVAEDDLRNSITTLTGGHPYYLRKCVETYKNYQLKGKVPRPSDFGKNLDEIVDKTIGSLDENAQLMTQRLCILKNWTDEVAAAVIDNFNNVTYKRVKKIVARAEQLSFGEEGYTFDKAIDAFLFPALKNDVTCQNLFLDIRDKANDYFKKFFAEEYDRRKQNYFFGMWGEIILRTTDKPAELMTLYDENFEPLKRRANYATLEVVVQKFFDKVGDNKTLPSAYFQSRLAELIRFNDSKKALELAEAAYSKVKKLSLTKDELTFKISVTSALARVFYRVRRYQDEIPLREEIVRDCKLCYPAKDERIIAAKEKLADALEKEKLADALEHADRKNEAFDVRKEIFESLDENDSEIYIDAAKNFVYALQNNGDYKSALPLRRKIVAFYEKVDDLKNLYRALSDIIDTLKYLSGEEYLEEKTNFYRQYMAVAEKIGESLSSDELEDFAETLRQLEREEEVEQLLTSQVDEYVRRIESFDESDAETVKLMEKLIDLLKATEQDEAAKLWRKKFTETVRVIINRYTADPVADHDAAIFALKNCSESIWFDYEQEEIELRRAILSLIEKKSDVEESQVIAAKKDLVTALAKSDENNYAEVNSLFEDVENSYRKNLPTTCKEFVKTLRDHAKFLKNKLDDCSVVREKLIEALEFLNKDSKSSANEILRVMKEIAEIFYWEENFSEAAAWHERILTFCQENFLEDAPETLATLNDLIRDYRKLENREKAEQYNRQRIALKEKKVGTSHIEVIRGKCRLADTLHKKGKFDNEFKLRKEIVDLWRENFNANAANKHKVNYWRKFIHALESLAKCHDELGQASEALDVRKEIAAAQEDRLRVLKENSAGEDDIIEALGNVADAFNAAGDYDKELFYRRELVDFCLKNKADSKVTLDAQEKLAETQKKIDALNQDAAPKENPPTEIDTSESLALRKGQRVPLTKNNPALNELAIECGRAGDADLEIDASAFLLGADDKVKADEDFIFYGNTRHTSGAVELDNSTLYVKLKKIPDAVERISFTLTIYEAEERGQNFSSVKVFARVIDEAARKEIFRFDLNESFSVETAIVVGEIYRHKGDWKFNAVGAGFTGGLAALCKNFGVEVN